MHRFGRILALIAPFLLLGACAFPFSDQQQMPYPQSTPDEVTARLKQAFELLELNRVSVLVNRTDCRLIEYRRGTFSPNSVEWCLEYAGGEPAPLTEEVTDEYYQLVASLDVGRAAFSAMNNAEYSADWRLIEATFTFIYNFGTELLVFDPGYRLPTDEPGERWYEAIDNEWYIVKVDWN